jgi:hypothetical protein
MSAYRGRTGPNFSEYLNNLNTLAPPYEEEQFNENLDINSDLAMFTNTDFTHFDIPAVPEDSNFDFDLGDNKPENFKYEDLVSGSGTNTNFNPSLGDSPADTSQFYPGYNASAFPAEGQGSGTQGAGRLGAEGTSSDNLSPEDKSRLAAEEDKRRRNTAASARFRVKKKQREQALERNVKEINDRNSKLEAKVTQLEMENKWLKDLITEKNAAPSREQLDAAYQKFKRESEEREVKESGHTTGIGTK